MWGIHGDSLHSVVLLGALHKASPLLNPKPIYNSMTLEFFLPSAADELQKMLTAVPAFHPLANCSLGMAPNPCRFWINSPQAHNKRLEPSGLKDLTRKLSKHHSTRNRTRTGLEDPRESAPVAQRPSRHSPPDPALRCQGLGHTVLRSANDNRPSWNHRTGACA